MDLISAWWLCSGHVVLNPSEAGWRVVFRVVGARVFPTHQFSDGNYRAAEDNELKPAANVT